MNIADLTKKLVSIPSYVDESCNEGKIGEFIFQYLKSFPWFEVQKIEAGKGRFNVIAKDKYPTRVLICNHIDTVCPQEGWQTDPFGCVEQNGKLYGLGASDTKGNVAAILTALKNAEPTKGLMLLFYIDEEYDLKGVKDFVEKYKSKISPKVIASGDGGMLEIGNACRGLIEINFKIKGKAGHAAIPLSGNNAIVGSFLAFKKLEEYVSKFANSDLGKSTINLAWVSGGQSKPDTETLGKEGNVIPDFAEFVIEIRTADEKLRAQNVINEFEQLLNETGLALISSNVRHDLGAWITDKTELKEVSKLLENPIFTKAQNRGYVDLQMLWESFIKPVCFTFGASEENTAHKPNEFVEIKKLEKAANFWEKILKNECK